MSDIVEVKPPGELAQAEPNVVDLLKHASASGCTPEVMERLVALYERSQAIKAREAFYVAMSEFKATCPPVKRCTPNSQFTVKRDGREVPRMYASLEDIASTVRGPLDACGLSYRWGDSTFDNGNATTCNDDHSLACEWSEWESLAAIQAEDKAREEEAKVDRIRDRT